MKDKHLLRNSTQISPGSQPEPTLRPNGAHRGESECARVVVVEDNGVISSFISEVLREELGCQPLVVDNGTRALEVLRNNHADVVLLDIDLPGLNGLEVYDRLRADPQTEHVPVVFMSAARHDADLAKRCVTSFLCKPFDLDELIDVVATQLVHPPG